MPKIGEQTAKIRLRPARIQKAADRQAESMFETINRVMDMSEEERQRLREALRAMAED